MQLSGNPFVDTGLMVLTALAGRLAVEDLTFSDLRNVFGDGSTLARQNQRLKSYTMVFGTNGTLTQHAYKKIGKNEHVYTGILSRLLLHAETEGNAGQPCDLTGILSDLNFHEIVCLALKDADLAAPDQKWIGRDWVPLGGSLGNDAQALPGASRPLHVSSLALFALQYLPLGVFLFKGRLACFQSTDISLPQSLVAAVVIRNLNSLDREILGKGAGSKVVLDFLLDLFGSLRDTRRELALPANTELLLWLFSNSGTGADCSMEYVPDSALEFIFEAARNYAAEIRGLMNGDSKDPRFQLFECIRDGRDYPGLYPGRKTEGASSEFYEFYQRGVRQITPNALRVARILAGIVVRETDEKNRKEICKPEFVKSRSGRSRIRRAIADHFTLAQYDSLFPSTHHPIRVAAQGWSLIEFYLHLEPEPAPLQIDYAMKTTHPKVVRIADAYFHLKGPKKIKNTLDRLAQRKLGIRWLQDVFCTLAEQEKELDLGTWNEFACNDEGQPVVFELLFQMRLYLANRYRESMTQQKETIA